MRKTLLSLILILLTATLFVACSSSPKEDEFPYVAEITVTGSGDYADYTGTYYLKGGDDHSTIEDEADSYKIYKDKECTEPLSALTGDEIPYEYLFSIALSKFGHTMYCANFIDAEDIQAQNKIEIPATYTQIDGHEYWNASFYAGNEFTFIDGDIEITVKFVKDTTLICEYYS